MKLIAVVLLVVGIGCARIYRPMEVRPLAATVGGPGLSGQVALQSWGDNSRYEGRARQAGLRVVVLSLENSTNEDVETLGLDLPPGADKLTEAEAMNLVKQRPWLFFATPAGLALSSILESPGGVGTAVVGALLLIIETPNALVAARSNRNLSKFLDQQAWHPGRMAPGQKTHGLLFLRTSDTWQPFTFIVQYRTALGEQRLQFQCP